MFKWIKKMWNKLMFKKKSKMSIEDVKKELFYRLGVLEQLKKMYHKKVMKNDNVKESQEKYQWCLKEIADTKRKLSFIK